MDHHPNSRPKFQPIRIKDLVHFCESDDDESEDRVQDSETDSDSEDPEPLPQDSSIVNDLSRSLPLPEVKYNNNVDSASKVSRTAVSSKFVEYTSIDDNVEHKTNNAVPEVHVSVHSNYSNVDTYDKYKDFKQDNHRTALPINPESQPTLLHEDECNIKVKQSTNFEQLSCRNSHAQEQVSLKEHKTKHVTIDAKRQPLEEQMYKSDIQSVNKCNASKKPGNNEFESIVFVSQHVGNALKSGTCNSQNNVNMRESLEQKSIINEEKAHNENISSTNKSLNSADQIILQTPLKHVSASSSRPDPCFSRRNIVQTPQNKLSDISRNHGLTPATNSCHWSQNNMRQTPLQNKSLNFIDSMQTPKNSVQLMTNK